jgi:protease-4
MSRPAVGDAVGVVVAQGEIVTMMPAGTIGARAAVELIQRAREDSGVKALVLRIDSRAEALSRRAYPRAA